MTDVAMQYVAGAGEHPLRVVVVGTSDAAV